MFGTIFLPNFSLQAALRHRSLTTDQTDQPIALIDEHENKPIILELTASAEAAGVSKGMTPSQGLARCLNLQIQPRSRVQENAVQEILLHHAFTLSPYVEDTAPGLCTVQFTDLRNLVSKMARVIDQLESCELIARGGIGPTPDTSFLAAHLAKPVLEITNASEFLAPLPIEILATPVENF
jgi:impB/mucB/samB family